MTHISIDTKYGTTEMTFTKWADLIQFVKETGLKAYGFETPVNPGDGYKLFF